MNRRARRHPELNDEVERLREESEWSGYTRHIRGISRLGPAGWRSRKELPGVIAIALLSGAALALVLWLVGRVLFGN